MHITYLNGNMCHKNNKLKIHPIGMATFYSKITFWLPRVQKTPGALALLKPIVWNECSLSELASPGLFPMLKDREFLKYIVTIWSHHNYCLSLFLLYLLSVLQWVCKNGFQVFKSNLRPCVSRCLSQNFHLKSASLGL